jgi:hypothetical protein
MIPCHRIDMLDVIDAQCVRAATEHATRVDASPPDGDVDVSVVAALDR